MNSLISIKNIFAIFFLVFSFTIVAQDAEDSSEENDKSSEENK